MSSGPGSWQCIEPSYRQNLVLSERMPVILLLLRLSIFRRGIHVKKTMVLFLHLLHIRPLIQQQ